MGIIFLSTLFLASPQPQTYHCAYWLSKMDQIGIYEGMLLDADLFYDWENYTQLRESIRLIQRNIEEDNKK